MSIALTERFRFAQALQSKPFALLWAGQTISTLGNGAYMTALGWQVLQLTNSAADTGLVLSVYMVTNVIFLLVGGVIADSLPRRLIMLWSDAGRAAIVLLIAGLSWTHTLQFWHLIVLAIFFGVVSAFFKPSYRSLPPQLVSTSILPSANALTEFSDQMGTFIGPLLGASCIAVAGPSGAFAFDGLTFLFSALCLLALRLPTTPTYNGNPYTRTEYGLIEPTISQRKSPYRWHKVRLAPYEDHTKITDHEQRHTDSYLVKKTLQVIAEIGEGLSYVRGSRWLWVTILVVSVVNIGMTGPLEAVLPKLVHDFYHADAWLLGWLGATSAIGLLLGTLFVGQFRQLRRRGLLAYLAIVIASVGIIVFGLPLPGQYEATIACIASSIVGFGFGMHGVIWLTVLQELVPANKLGRVSSIDLLGSFCLLPLGYTLSGALADQIGPGNVFIVGGFLSLVVTCAALCIRDIRGLE